ncbi:MAG: hypothetical protein IKX00_00325 [Bacilli bacterium]|nr:hypothetical protein [Bacilli bacterium]
MQKIFGIDKYKFYISDISTSVIYNEEIIKNKIIHELIKKDFLVIDSKVFDGNLSVKDVLKSLKFDMKLIPYYNLKDLLNERYINISFEEQLFIKVISLICDTKSRIVFDDVLTFLNDKQKYLILKYIKDNNIIFYNFTSDIEEVLFTKYLIALSASGVIVEGSTKSVLKEEKILKHNGFSLPFVVELSTHLKDYGILDKEYYSLEKLVNELWK